MIRRVSSCAALAVLFLFATPKFPNANPQTIDRTAVIAVLEDQKTAWNRGDVPAFMNGYWRSPDVTFAGKAWVISNFQNWKFAR
jgi:hypothetical protein